MATKVILINSVLNAIPIYSLSFYNVPSKVLNEIRQIQSNFLWNKKEDVRSIHWLRILNESEALWSGLLRGRYGDPGLKELIGAYSVLSKTDSIWWRDVVLSNNIVPNFLNLFTGAVISAVNSGRDTAFWKSIWMGNQLLMEAFPEEFAAGFNRNCSVAQLATASNTVHGDVVKAMVSLWKIDAPPKLQFLGWRVLHNRLATKDQLISRNILLVSSDPCCVLCSSQLETNAHLFGDCPFTDYIWQRVVFWLDPLEEVTLDEFKNFSYHVDKVKNVLKRKVVGVIWLVTIWSV
ncbi:uncharacterized protein LOC131595221 [Vicia villosa]|uniref:uncharacterized protein LOC131595221 n=1 Tax=Vicia villosa TaxID=3911 RepID=UPI00273C23A4|nr:uncharacterized protein LOC131595221 [Vicia villosa]